jgi:hypothetical protein
MIRGWLEPGLVIVLSCHAAAWLSQQATDAAQSVTAELRPHDHYCVHCGQPNPVDFEDLMYRCGSCQGRNNRMLELAMHWQTDAKSAVTPMPPEMERPQELMAAD